MSSKTENKLGPYAQQVLDDIDDFIIESLTPMVSNFLKDDDDYESFRDYIYIYVEMDEISDDMKCKELFCKYIEGDQKMHFINWQRVFYYLKQAYFETK